VTTRRASGLHLLFHSPLFWGVFGIKLLLGSLVASSYLRDLFLPFVNYFVDSGFADPWRHFLAVGQVNAFPYPPVMLYVLALPRFLFGFLLPKGSVTFGHLLVARLPLLACDVTLAAILARWFPFRVRKVLLYYWCSPVLLYITYWHGQLDLIPTTIFLLGLVLLQEGRDLPAMVLVGLSLATKTHLLVALPFLFSYLRVQVPWPQAVRRMGVVLGVWVLAMCPYLFRPAFQTMVFGSQEQARVFAFHVPLEGSHLTIYLAPLALTILWLRFDGYRKKNWDLLLMYLGIVFAVFITLAPPRPAYFLWCLPFIVYYLLAKGRARVTSFHLYSVAYLLYFLLGSESDLLDAWKLTLPELTTSASGAGFQALIQSPGSMLLGSLFFTVMVATMAELLLQMYLLGVRSNVVYRERVHPMIIGLAGDSGSGKDTFSTLASRALGKAQTLLLAGDDYHRWPRGHEMWNVYTHLDVRANDLNLQQEHAFAISSGNSVVKGEYDHDTGQFSEQERVDPKKFVVLQGLHSLAMDRQRRLCDLRVFLDPQEDLRIYWKVERDGRERGYSPEKVLASLEARRGDREKFILPQRERAQLIVKYWGEGYHFEPEGPPPEGLSLDLLVQNSFFLEPLVEGLRDLRELDVHFDPFRDVSFQFLRLSGEVSAEDLLSIVRRCVPGFQELSVSPDLVDGVDGCLQAILLLCLSEQLRWSGVKEDSA
jgi:uridine kinase